MLIKKLAVSQNMKDNEQEVRNKINELVEASNAKEPKSSKKGETAPEA